MTRISMAVQLDEADLAALDPGGRIEKKLGGIWAHRPAVARARRELSRALAETGTLPARLVELVRLRIAFHNQCRSCMAVRYSDAIEDGLTEELVCSLERPEEADDLTDAEKSALRFADLMATNHLAIDDAVFDDLREHYTEGEIVELGINCAQYVGFGRMAATWGMHEHLHERFRQEQDEAFTPWGEGALR
jgi:AhpD family alkylhydroperoxidase